MTSQLGLGMVEINGELRFVEVVPRNGAKPVLHVADHPQHGPVRFDLDGDRFATQGFRLVLIGASGAGKSYALGVIAEEVHRIGVPFVVFDQESEFTSLGELPGVETLELHRDTDLVPGEISDFVLREGGAVVLDVGELGLESQRYCFALFAKYYYNLAKSIKRRSFVFVDEAAELAPQRRLSGADESREWLERYAKRGRKRGINWVLATQRPGDLSKSVFAQANAKLIGRVEIINDYDAIRPYLSRRVALTELANLPAGDFLLDIGGVTEVVRVRARRTEDLGWTPTD